MRVVWHDRNEFIIGNELLFFTEATDVKVYNIVVMFIVEPVMTWPVGYLRFGW